MKDTKKFKDYINKIFINYTILLIGLILILFITSLYLNFRNTVIRVNDLYNEGLANFLDEEFNKHKESLSALGDDTFIKSAINDGNYLMNANMLLYKYCNANNIRANFVLADKDFNIITTNFYNIESNLSRIKKSIENLSYYLLKDSNTVDMTLDIFDYNGRPKPNLLFGKPIVEDNKRLGYLLFYIREDDLKNYVGLKDVDSIALTDRFNNIFYTTNESLADNMGKFKLEKDGKRFVSFNEKNYYIKQNSIQNGNINVITMTSISRHQEFFKVGILAALIISIVILILIMWLSPVVAKRSLHSFDSLIYAVSLMKEGNMDYRIESKTFEEFQIIYDEFNSMTYQIQNLIKRNEEIAERKRLTEIKHLESQYNPHFLFNVLEMLKYEILFDPKRAANMVVSFANLMRYNIYYGSVEVPLKTDISYLEDYLKIQKMRFNTRLDYSIEVDDALLNNIVPKLILQPIVENSIKYGIENTNHLEITIQIDKYGNDIRILIIDNGRGIEKHKLEEIINNLQNESATPNSIGLYNVHRVIKLLYGDEYGIDIESDKNGTKVKILIPIMGVVEDV